jgi:hypothetical protein
MPKVPWENIDDYMEFREPNLDRSTWTKSNFWQFGSSSFKGRQWPKKKFDSKKCPRCGGKGTVESLREDPRGKRRRIKRIIPCPENCEYTINW